MSKITKITQNIIFSQFEAALCQDWIRQQIAPSSRVALTSGASDKASRFSRSHQQIRPSQRATHLADYRSTENLHCLNLQFRLQPLIERQHRTKRTTTIFQGAFS